MSVSSVTMRIFRLNYWSEGQRNFLMIILQSKCGKQKNTDE